MFCVPCAPTRQTGFAELGSPPTKSPLLHDEKLAPVTAFAVSRSDCVALAPPAIAVPFPALVAVIFPDVLGPEQVVLLKSRQSTEAEPTPAVLTLTLPSVKVVDAVLPDEPVACTV